MAAAWIVLSDVVVGVLEAGALGIPLMQTAKGLLFVLITSLFLFYFLRGNLRRLHDMQVRAEQVERLRVLGETAGAIAHDFRNLLMICRVHAELVRRNSAPENVRVQRAVGQIMEATRRGEQITAEILAFAEPKHLKRERIDLRAFLNAVAEELRPGIPPDVSLKVSVSPDPVIVDADARLLHRTMLNLAANARDAIAGPGTITLAARPAPAAKDHVQICVSDTGSGIPPEIMDRVFEPRVTTKKSGSGLGLAIVRRIVTDHGGEVTATSAAGRGTTIQILLPATAPGANGAS